MARLDAELRSAADPVRAAGMAAYMRDQFPFAGVPRPELATIARRVLAGLATPRQADLRDVALSCWRRAEREFQYFACGLLRRHVARVDARLLGTVRGLIVTKSWWDTVDDLASHVVGPLVVRYPALAETMDEWIDSDELWLIRTALLHQLGRRDGTDSTRLFDYCRARAEHKDFFIRKGIGWALRDYARTAPDEVQDFVRSNQARLSPLSVREATRHIGL